MKIRKSAVICACIGMAFFISGCSANSVNVTAGMNQIKQLDYRSALESFSLAREKGENLKLVARGEGIAYMGMTEYELAVQSFEEALTYSNGILEEMDFDLNYYLAAAYMKIGGYEEAKSIYDAILVMRPEDAEALFLRGNVKMHLQEYDAAKLDFDRVVALDDKNFDRMIQICRVLQEAGYRDAGKSYLEKAIANYEHKMSAYDRGRIYFYLEEYQKAYLALEEAKDDGGAEAYIYLGKAYEATGDYNYASSVYQHYLSKYGANATIYNQLGLCEMAKHNYEQALMAFQSGMQVEDNDIMQSMQFNEIVAHEYLGDYKEATALLEHYIEVYPDDEKALREYDFLISR